VGSVNYAKKSSFAMETKAPTRNNTKEIVFIALVSNAWRQMAPLVLQSPFSTWLLLSLGVVAFCDNTFTVGQSIGDY